MSNINTRDRNTTRRPSNRPYQDGENKMEMEVLEVKRVSCTTAGGRKASFSALVAQGDGKGTIGIGFGKAKEVPDAIGKAERHANKNLIKIPMYKSSIMHDCKGKAGATTIIFKRAKAGTGFVTCNIIKSVLRVGGLKDLVAKVHGSSNTNNVVRALIDAINSLESPKKIAARRGKSLAEIMHPNKIGTILQDESSNEEIEENQEIVRKANKNETR